MKAIFHKCQLPGAIARATRQRDVLQVAAGFTKAEIEELTAIYDAFIAKATEIKNKHK